MRGRSDQIAIKSWDVGTDSGPSVLLYFLLLMIMEMYMFVSYYLSYFFSVHVDLFVKHALFLSSL